MDKLSDNAVVLAILFMWLDNDKQEEILKLLKVKERQNEKGTVGSDRCIDSGHDPSRES